MIFDVFTMLTGSVAGILLSSVLVLYFWRRLPKAKWLGVWGLGYFAIGSGHLLIVLRDALPDYWGVALGGALALLGFAVMWTAMRIFEKRNVVWPMVFFGALVWLLAFLVPDFQANIPIKVSLGSALVSMYALLAAKEIWRGRAEKLPSRVTILNMFLVIAGVFALRIILSPFVAFPLGGLAVNSIVVASFNGLLVAVAITLSVLVVSMTMERAEMAQRSLALTDCMTGLSNRRSLENQYGEKILDANTSVIVFDLDHFKNVNDKFGHAVGDGVIKSFADTCRENFRQIDLAVRMGGEEFAIILPRTSLSQAVEAAERVRKVFSEMVVEVDGVSVVCTVSAGVASVARGNSWKLDTLLAEADKALYRAKRAGRNRVFLPPLTQAA